LPKTSYKQKLIRNWNNEFKADSFGFLSNQENSSLFSQSIMFYFLFLKFCELYHEHKFFRLNLGNFESHPPSILKLRNLFEIEIEKKI